VCHSGPQYVISSSYNNLTVYQHGDINKLNWINLCVCHSGPDPAGEAKQQEDSQYGQWSDPGGAGVYQSTGEACPGVRVRGGCTGTCLYVC
jgi:hypothetical protein